MMMVTGVVLMMVTRTDKRIGISVQLSSGSAFCVQSNMETRNSIATPILEEAPLENLNGTRLPTRKDIFRHYWYHKNAGKSISEAQLLASKAAVACWERVGLVPKGVKYIKADITKMNSELRVE